MADIYILVLLVLVYAAGLLLFWYGARLRWGMTDTIVDGPIAVGNSSKAGKVGSTGPADWWAHWPDGG